jgi:hypothetical protein
MSDSETNPLEPQGCAACDLGEKFTETRAFVHTGVGVFCKGKHIGNPDLGPVERDDEDSKPSGRVCGNCGGAGHNARTCKVKMPTTITQVFPVKNGKVTAIAARVSDNTYMITNASKVTDGASTGGGRAPGSTEINALAMGVVPVARQPGQRGCKLCGQAGHYAKSCKARNAAPPPTVDAPSVNELRVITPTTAKCRKCGAAGHVEVDCWVTARDAAKRGISAADLKHALTVPKKIAAAKVVNSTNGCKICGGTKHSADDCPSNPANAQCNTCGLRHSNVGPCPNAEFFK